MSQETTFFEHDGVRITNTRFVVDGQTYAMSNITSVKAIEENPSRIFPALLMVVGAAGLINGGTIWMGALLLAGIAWWLMQKTTFHVMLHTAGGETSALKTFQREYVQKVVTALNNAIVYRG